MQANLEFIYTQKSMDSYDSFRSIYSLKLIPMLYTSKFKNSIYIQNQLM